MSRVVDDYNALEEVPIANKDLHNLYSAETIQQLKTDDEVITHHRAPKKSLNINADGTHSIFDFIEMTQEQAKDPDYVMRSTGYPPDKWTLIKLRMSEWNTRNKNNELLMSYSYQLEVKPRVLKDAGLPEIKKLIETMEYREPVVEIGYEVSNPHALEIDFADLHIFGGQLDKNEFFTKVERMREDILKEKYEIVYVCFMGDALHVDSLDEKTTRGTQLKITGTAYEMLREAQTILSHVIRRLAVAQRLEIIWVQGNHSRLLEYSLMQTIETSFKDNKHIHFDTSEFLRKAFLYGNTLVGLHHGDIPRKNTFSWLQFEFSQLWGQAQFWEIHNGHYHNEEVKTEGGQVARTVTTPKGTDGYEDRQGYRNDRRKVMAFSYDKLEGLDAIKYY